MGIFFLDFTLLCVCSYATLCMRKSGDNLYESLLYPCTMWVLMTELKSSEVANTCWAQQLSCLFTFCKFCKMSPKDKGCHLIGRTLG